MANIREVAKKAGVSPGTASRALNGKDGVGERARKRVLNAAKELGYNLSPVIRSASAATPCISIIVNIEDQADIDHGYHYRMLSVISETLTAAGYRASIVRINSQTMSSFDEKLIAERAQLCGILVYTLMELDKNWVSSILDIGVPVVMMGQRIKGINCVTIDNAGGILEAVDHLLSLNHERIAYVRHKTEGILDDIERMKEYKRLMKSCGRKPIIISSEQELVEIMSESGSRPTALICFEDFNAIRTSFLLSQNGLKIPQDVSIVGFGNIPELMNLFPDLTTVFQPVTDHAAMAVHRLINILDDNDVVPSHIILNTNLIVRGSCTENRENAAVGAEGTAV